VFLSGIPSLMMMPLFPFLIKRFDLRLVVLTGMLVMAGSCWLDTTLTVNSDGSDFVISQLMRGLGQALAMLFLNQAAIASVKPDEAGDASGLFNAARNLGGSIALALLATLQERREEFHRWTIHEALPANSPTVQDWVASQVASFGGGPTALPPRCA
jgi:DHA2 family multidrug resistance protein